MRASSFMSDLVEGVDQFATYAYSICQLEYFLLLLGLKRMKTSSRLQIIFIPVGFLRGFDS